eukprot:COSAG01_NODE_55391_length_325_cov_0.911504_1_plen_48_part_01
MSSRVRATLYQASCQVVSIGLPTEQEAVQIIMAAVRMSAEEPQSAPPE